MSEKIETGDTVLVKLGGNGFWCEGEVLKVGDDGRAFVAESTGPEFWRHEGDYLLLRKGPRKVLDSRGVEIKVGDTVAEHDRPGLETVEAIKDYGGLVVHTVDSSLTFRPSSLTVVILPDPEDEQ